MNEIDTEVRALLGKGSVNEAATLVLRKFGPEVLGFLIKTLGGAAAADDVFAVVSERTWLHLGDFRWQCSLRTWIYKIARNESLRYLDGARRQVKGRVSSSALEEVAAYVRTETVSILRSEKANKLLALCAELPFDDHTMLTLRLSREMQWKEIAHVFLGEEGEVAPAAIKLKADTLRHHFRIVKKQLAQRAWQEGLIEWSPAPRPGE